MIIRCASKRRSGRDEARPAVGLALLDDDLFGLVKAHAALRLAPERRVDRLGIAFDVPRRMAQLAVADGIADADVHRLRVSRFAGVVLMRMACISKRIQRRSGNSLQ